MYTANSIVMHNIKLLCTFPKKSEILFPVSVESGQVGMLERIVESAD